MRTWEKRLGAGSLCVAVVVAATGAGIAVAAGTGTAPEGLLLCVSARGVVTAGQPACPAKTVGVEVARQAGVDELFQRVRQGELDVAATESARAADAAVVEALEERVAQLEAAIAVLDGDGDGVGVAGGDCDDDDPAQYPDAVEVDDQLDNDCDGGVDEGLSAAATDADLDGQTPLDGDCQDDGSDADSMAFTATIYAGAPEINDSHDNDCDGFYNEIETNEKCWNGVDDDLDGKVDAADVHCTGTEGWFDRKDTDADGSLDAHDDDDDDGDGVLDAEDPMPKVRGR